MSLRILDVDKGYAKVRAFAGASGSVKVGVPDTPHQPSGIPTDEIAKKHEFGDGTVPERSFLRAWVDQNERRIKAKAKNSLLWALDTGAPFNEALGLLGQWSIWGVRAFINKKIPPPLSRRTLKTKKGEFRTTPLIDTTQLWNSITCEVEGKQGQVVVTVDASAGELSDTLVAFNGDLGMANTVVAPGDV